MSILDDVKSRTDIVQVVSDYVDLDTSSRVPKALCPFHTERTPSFVVYPESGTWHCFGACSTGGDAITFLMKREGMSFREALKRLADHAGIQLDVAPGTQQRQPTTSLYQANEIAAAFFRSLLAAPGGEKAHAYLEARGISMEVAARRGLGLSPDGLVTLGGHLRAKGVDGRSAVAAGLVTRSADGSWRDTFRGRLTIEICDARGRIVGFGARSLDGGEPKYLNTAATEIFDKSSLLYGMHWANESIRSSSEAVVVEGYMDAITAHEHGFRNVVASMGTAVTQAQLEALGRTLRGSSNGGTVTWCLDSDAAGSDATFDDLIELAGTWKTTSRFSEKLFDLRVVQDLGGKDPDETIRTDPERWRESVRQAASLFDYLLSVCQKRYNLDTGTGKSQVIDLIAPIILREPNVFEQDRQWVQLADTIGVEPERLKAMVQKPSARRAPRTRPLQEERVAPAQTAAALSSDGGVEDYLLTLLLTHDDLREFAPVVPPEHFHEPGNRAIFTVWQTVTTLAELQESLDPLLSERLGQLKVRPMPPADHLQRIQDVTQCVRRLKERHLRNIKLLEEKAFAELELQLGVDERDRLHERALESNSSLRQVFTGRT